jgi:hypothetical protein
MQITATNIDAHFIYLFISFIYYQYGVWGGVVVKALRY